MSVNLDNAYIMNALTTFGQEFFAAENNADKSSTVKLKKGNKTEEATCTFKELPPYILPLINELIKNLMEKQENEIAALKTYFDDEIKKRDDKIDDLKSEIRNHRNDQDALANYNRRENLKIQGVPVIAGENTNEIVKEICKYAGREITDADISTSHRNGSVNPNTTALPGLPTAVPRKIPDIYVRFVRRDLKNEVFDLRKNLATKSGVPVKYRNVAIYEDVTPLRSRIMFELRNRDEKKAFKYVWSRGGRIYCKTPEQAEATPSQKPTVINKPEDLSKVGFSEQEIETIILNKRD